MIVNSLGEIKRVTLQKVWKSGVPDFTDWLAMPESLDLLSKELGMNINLLETQAGAAGRFHVDILAEEKSTKCKIVIENQFKATRTTDYECLGKLLAYVSEFDARIGVWITEEVSEEHRRAIDWLNGHTDADYSFFLVQIKAWQINNSSVAPQFSLIAKPDGWSGISANGKVTKTAVQQLLFWERLQAYAKEHGQELPLQNLGPYNWVAIGIGHKYARVLLKLNTMDAVIVTGLNIISDSLYQFLYQRRSKIERELGLRGQLQWHNPPSRKLSRIYIEMPGQINNPDEWDECCKWLLTMAQRFQKVFAKHAGEHRQRNRKVKVKAATNGNHNTLPAVVFPTPATATATMASHSPSVS